MKAIGAGVMKVCRSHRRQPYDALEDSLFRVRLALVGRQNRTQLYLAPGLAYKSR